MCTLHPLLLIHHPPTVFPYQIFLSGSEFISGIGVSGVSLYLLVFVGGGRMGRIGVWLSGVLTEIG